MANMKPLVLFKPVSESNEFSFDSMSDEDIKVTILGMLNDVNRPGMDRLINWLVKTDYFTAPASTKFHGSYPGGLARHSLNVFFRLSAIVGTKANMERNPALAESLSLVALLHDVCKCNVYTQETRSRKTGQFYPSGKPIWEDYTAYSFHDDFHMIHGEKSCFLIRGFLGDSFTREEYNAVRWHMGYSDVPNEQRSMVGDAFNQYPLALALHMADQMATSFDENELFNPVLFTKLHPGEEPPTYDPAPAPAPEQSAQYAQDANMQPQPEPEFTQETIM